MEALQETLTDMISDADISESLEQDDGPLQVDDDEPEEYNALCLEIQVPEEINLPMPPSTIPGRSKGPLADQDDMNSDDMELIPLNG